MPYNLFTKVKAGKKLFCMEAINSGKKYCYKSKADRAMGMKMHHAFDTRWKPTGKAKA